IAFEKDQKIIRQGQAHSSMFFIADGVLHVNRHADDSNVFLGRLEKGSFFGEIGLFDPGMATATIRAMGKGKVYEVTRDDFFTLLDQQPALGCKLLKAMMQEMSKR